MFLFSGIKNNQIRRFREHKNSQNQKPESGKKSAGYRTQEGVGTPARLRRGAGDFREGYTGENSRDVDIVDLVPRTPFI
jgi:hypothetical protein